MGAEQGKLQWNSELVDCTTDTAEEVGKSAFQYECAEANNDLRDRITLFHFALLLVLTLLMVRTTVRNVGETARLPVLHAGLHIWRRRPNLTCSPETAATGCTTQSCVPAE